MRREKISQTLTVAGYKEICRKRRYYTNYLVNDLLRHFSKDARTVLDVGPGPGVMSELLLRKMPQAGSYIGADVDPDMIPFMNDINQKHYPRSFFIINDRAALPFRSGAFDLAVSMRTLHHFKYPEKMLAEMARVVSDTGKVLVYDFNPEGLRCRVLKGMMVFYNFFVHSPAVDAFIDSFNVSYKKCDIYCMVENIKGHKARILQKSIFNILILEKEN